MAILATVAALAKAGGIAPEGGTGTLDDLERVAKRAGVGLCVNLPIATRPDQAASINRFAREINRRCYSLQAAEARLEKPVVREQLALLRLRNT